MVTFSGHFYINTVRNNSNKASAKKCNWRIKDSESLVFWALQPVLQPVSLSDCNDLYHGATVYFYNNECVTGFISKINVYYCVN